VTIKKSKNTANESIT